MISSWQTQLTDATAAALESCLSDLRMLADDSFDYFVLSTVPEPVCPVFSACSTKMLERMNSHNNPHDSTPYDLKWVFQESPLYNFGARHFAKVELRIQKRIKEIGYDAACSEEEYENRMIAYVNAMNFLNEYDFTGLISKRSDLVINVEVVPPDTTNTARVLSLNPRDAVQEWIREVGEA